MTGKVRGCRPLLLVWVGVLCTLSAMGCSNVDMKKFAHATRVDVRSNVRWTTFDPPFGEQFARVPSEGHVVCEDREALQGLYEKLSLYGKKWENWWALPPDTPPVVLEFYAEAHWLGTIDLYDWAIGHNINLIHRLEPEQAAEILRIICDCADSGVAARIP